jgi:hypothetical protein
MLRYGGYYIKAFPELVDKPFDLVLSNLEQNHALTAWDSQVFLEHLIQGKEPPKVSEQAAYFAACRVTHAQMLLEKITNDNGLTKGPCPVPTEDWGEMKMIGWLLFEAWHENPHDTLVTIAYRFQPGALTLYP